MGAPISNTVNNTQKPVFGIPQKKTNLATLGSKPFTTANSTPVKAPTQSTDSWESSVGTPAVVQKTPIISNAAQSKTTPTPQSLMSDLNTAQQMLNQVTGKSTQPTLGLVTPPSPVPTTTPTEPNKPKALFSDVASSLYNRGTTTNADYLQRQKEYQDKLDLIRKFKTSAADTAAGLAGQGTSARVLQGRQQALQQANAETLRALEEEATQAQQGIGFSQAQQGLEQAALNSAGGFATPIQVPYSNQLVNPLTGESMGSGSANMQSAVQNVTQKLQTGQMSYEDAKAALAGYGQGGLDMLNRSLPTGFSIPQSNVLVQQQGTIGPAMSLANTALQNVKNIMSQLPDVQNTNIPLINYITRGVSTQTGIGSEQTRALTGAIQSLKNNYAALLASTKGGTPTDYSSQVNAEIPDNATMNDILAVEHNMQVLGQARQQIYGNPGMSGSTAATGGIVQTSAGPVATGW